MSNNFPIAVIRSKLYRPTIANDVIERSRLLEQASLGLDNSITLLSAQAGYGKSTLVSQWLDRAGTKSAWLSLDASDRDLPQFLAYVVAAIRTVFPDSCQEVLEYLRMATAASPVDLAGALINDLDQIDDRLILVLDDYHLLGDSSVHDFLDSLLRHPPRSMHLVIVTRRDPPLSLQPLRAAGVLTEIRMQDLLFTESESCAFINKRLGDNISQTAISQMHQATAGWPVGIRLATLAAHGANSVDSFAHEMFSNSSDLRDYLITEVLAQQPPAIRAGLLKTSFFDRFNAPLCDTVLSELAGSEFVQHIRESGLLNIALDENQEWFRYHHLLQSTLQQLAIDELGESKIHSIHVQASRWLEGQGFLDDAIRHLVACKDNIGASELIVRHRNRIMNLEQVHRIEPWLALLPVEIIDENPGLIITLARIQQTNGTLNEAWRLLDSAERLLETMQIDPREKREWQASIESLRCYQHYVHSNGKAAVESAKFAIEHLPANSFAERGFALTIVSGALQMTGRFDLAKSTLYDALAQESRADDESRTQRVRIFLSLAFVSWMNADVSGHRAAVKELTDAHGSHGLEETFVIARFLQATSNYHEDNLEAAAGVFDVVTNYTSLSNILFFTQCAFISSLAQQEQGHSENANRIARFSLEFALKHKNKPMIVLSEAFLAELALRQGRISEALQWTETYEPGPFAPMYEFYSPSITWAKILITEASAAKLDRARVFLDEFADYLESIHNKHFLIEVFAIRAMLFEANGERDFAIRDLTQSVSLALPSRFIRIFEDLGPKLGSLLGKLDLDEESLVYVGEILAAFRDNERSHRTGTHTKVVTKFDNQSEIDPLSKREQQVLTLLADRLSNKEIADELNISVVTVKRHAANIYEKLGVHDRKKAVAKAAGLGFIR